MNGSPFDRLIRFQTSRPLTVLLLAGVATAASLYLAGKLKLITTFDALLPEGRPSVLELHRVQDRTASLSTIFVVLEGNDTAGLRKAADALVPALTALGAPWVGEATDGVHEVVRYLQPRAGLFASQEALEKLRDQVAARYAYEVGQRSGMLRGLEEDAPPPPIDAEQVKKDFGIRSDDTDRYPDGYYQSADGKTLVVAIRCGVLSTDPGKAEEALRRVGDVVARVNPRAYDPTAKWGLSGDLAIGLAEFKLVSADLASIGVLGAALILGVVLLYYLRIRMLVAMGLNIGVGLAWTFGLTDLLLGHLNLATGFLFTIVGGNGINFSIIFMARYLEERRQGATSAEASDRAMRGTWKPTLTAAAAAAGSYGALMVSEFNGFREFGVIGGMGMLVCWLATYLVLPSILTQMERVMPLNGSSRGGVLGRLNRLTSEGVQFGRPFAALVARAPGFIAGAGVLLAVAGGLATAHYIRADPMEYDTNQIQSDRHAVAEVHRLIGLGIRITGYVGLDGMAILTERPEQVAPLKAALEARRDGAPADAKPFKAVHALQDYVPTGQDAKIPVLLDLAKQIRKARHQGVIKDADWNKISAYLPPADLKPFEIADLPEGLARPFTEADGTRGRIVYISPLDGDVTFDAHYLLRWADSFRRTVLPDGSVILGSGRAVIFADMWAAVVSDVPPAVLCSFLATLFIVAFAFRRRWATASVMLGLGVGVFWMVGALTLLKVKLNFLNFIALPVTFGIGVDYAVNIIQRDQDLKDPLEVLRRTGGAVILCSLTTLLGYLALVRSVNFGVRSLGVAAVLGEVSCLLAAVLVLPAVLVWWRSRNSNAEAQPQAAPGRQGQTPPSPT